MFAFKCFITPPNLHKHSLHATDSAPTDSEKHVHSEVAAVLEKVAGILKDLREYKGAGVAIREVCIMHLCTVSVRKYVLCVCVLFVCVN